MTPATSYYGSKDYQKVNGILPVETYADLSSIVNGLESNRSEEHTSELQSH